jgi:hypothetical protein
MKYKKPRTLNWVTFFLVGSAGLFIYLLYYMWPMYSLRARAKGILLDHVPVLYKANLRDSGVAGSMIDDIKASVASELKKAGINEKAAKLYITRNPKEISLELRFKVKVHFPFPDKTYEIEVSPKVVSDAERVDW